MRYKWEMKHEQCVTNGKPQTNYKWLQVINNNSVETIRFFKDKLHCQLFTKLAASFTRSKTYCLIPLIFNNDKKISIILTFFVNDKFITKFFYIFFSKKYTLKVIVLHQNLKSMMQKIN